MPRLLLVLALALTAPRVGLPSPLPLRASAFVAACTAVQNDPTPGNLTCTVTAGENLIVVYAWDPGTADLTPTTDKSDVFQTPACGNFGAGTRRMCVAFVGSAVGGSTIFTFTQTLAVFDYLNVFRYTGHATASSIDGTPVTAEWSGASSPQTSSSITATTAGRIFGAVMASVASPAPASGETERDEQVNNYYVSLQDRAVTAGGVTTSWSWTGTNSGIYVALVVKDAAAAPSFPAAIINALLRGGGDLFWPLRFQ